MREAGNKFLQQQDEEMRRAQQGMSAWQREQVRMNDESFMRRWGIRNRARTAVPSAEDRLERVRQEQEERARKLDQERYEAHLQAQREALDRRAAIEAHRQEEMRQIRESTLRLQAKIAIERSIQHPGDYR